MFTGDATKAVCRDCVSAVWSRQANMRAAIARTHSNKQGSYHNIVCLTSYEFQSGRGSLPVTNEATACCKIVTPSVHAGSAWCAHAHMSLTKAFLTM